MHRFLWGSKIETISRKTISCPVLKGLNVTDIQLKSQALKVASLVDTVERDDSKSFVLKYFAGSRLAHMRPNWLRDNLDPNSLLGTKYYTLCLIPLRTFSLWLILIHLRFRLRIFIRFCWLKELVLLFFLFPWQIYVKDPFRLDKPWGNVKNDFTENVKNDLLWLVILRGLKVRDSLHSWGYIREGKCAVCDNKETIVHALITCARAKRVWLHFKPTLSALIRSEFLIKVQSVFFFQ